MESRTWYDADNKKCSEEEMLSWLNEACSDKFDETQLIVGTDSHLHGYAFRFVTVVCAYHPGRGGNFRYTLSYQDRANYRGNQKARMFHEASLSIEMSDFLLERTEMVPVIHIDASPKGAGEFTSLFSDQLKGYVVGSGYQCALKPESWVANAVADRFTK